MYLLFIVYYRCTGIQSYFIGVSSWEYPTSAYWSVWLYIHPSLSLSVDSQSVSQLFNQCTGAGAREETTKAHMAWTTLFLPNNCQNCNNITLWVAKGKGQNTIRENDRKLTPAWSKLLKLYACSEVMT